MWKRFLLTVLLAFLLADCSSGHSGGLGNVTISIERHIHQDTPDHKDQEN